MRSGTDSGAGFFENIMKLLALNRVHKKDSRLGRKTILQSRSSKHKLEQLLNLLNLELNLALPARVSCTISMKNTEVE